MNKRYRWLVFFCVLLLAPWVWLGVHSRVLELDMSCRSDYEIAEVKLLSSARSYGVLQNDFKPDGKVLIRYAGAVEVRDNNKLEKYSVHRVAELDYFFFDGYLRTVTLGGSQAVTDDAPDDLVYQYVNPAFKQNDVSYSYGYALSPYLFAAGLQNSPRVLCKIE